jgi:DNA-binding HxlR family transcriptional regulator
MAGERPRADRLGMALERRRIRSQRCGPRPARGTRPAQSPLAVALQALGGRARRLVLWHLFWAPRTVFELLRCHPRIGRRALGRELAELERLGLVRYEVRNRSSEGAVYALTPIGETLKPVLAEMYLWGLHASTPGQRAVGAAAAASMAPH